MTKPLATIRGRLTRYALTQGYVEMTKLPSGESVTLWLDRQLLHVRHYDPDRDDGKRTWVFWEVFTSITKARRSYDDARRQILNRHGRKPIPSV